MTNTNNNIQESKLDKTLNWIGDKLYQGQQYAYENNLISIETREFLAGMDVVTNYNLIYNQTKTDNQNISEFTLKLTSGTGAVLQAYTGPTLEYVVDKMVQVSSKTFGLFGDNKAEILLSNVDRGLYAQIAQNVGMGIGKIGAGIDRAIANTKDILNDQQNSLITQISPDGQSSSAEISQNKDGISIQTEGFLDSNDKIAKDAISNSSLVSEDSKSIKIKINEDEFSLSKGNKQEDPLKNSGLLAENPEYIDKNGNAISQQEAIFTVEDSNGNINTIQKEGVMTTLKDGTKALLSAVVEMTEKAADVTKEFVDGYMNQANKLFTTGDGIASLINNIIIIKRLMQH